MRPFLTVARLLCVCLTLSGLLSHAVAEPLTMAASRAKGRAGPDAPAARPTSGPEVVSIRNRQGEQVGVYRASYALVIGVSGYTHWPQLSGVAQDTAAVIAVLQTQGFQVVQIRDPTYDDLRRAFDDFITKHGEGEDHRLLIYFAGHGHTLKLRYGADMGYIVPRDAPDAQRDEAAFRARALSMHEIETYARRIQSKHALFVFDSCFSGSIFSMERAAPLYISYKTSRPVRQFITSGQADEKVPDVSIFRQQFVAALQGEADKDGDGYVTGMELGEFLQQQVTNFSRNTQHPQYGKLRDQHLGQGDFVFTVTRAAPPRPSSPSLADLQTQVEAQRQQVQTEQQRLEKERRSLELDRLTLKIDRETWESKRKLEQINAEIEQQTQALIKSRQQGGSPQSPPVARLEPQVPQPGNQTGRLPTPTRAQHRTALVIGNSTYTSSPLRNPVNDASDMASALKRLNFDVTLELDTSRERMDAAVRSFQKKLGRTVISLFYYAGHAVQYGGENYLIPIDTIEQITAPEHLRDKAVNTGDVLDAMAHAGNGVNIVILDACRGNPLRGFSRSAMRGLAVPPDTTGVLIAYPTSPGKTADDGHGRNSLYTKHLLHYMTEPNLTIETTLENVIRAVEAETRKRQVPWYYSSLRRAFYLVE